MKGFFEMKSTHSGLSLLLAAGLVALGAGCVARPTYQRALDANVQAQAQLQDIREQLGQRDEAMRMLNVELAAAKRAVQQKDQVIDQLQEAIGQGNARFAELQARYERDTRDIGPAPLGSIALPDALDRQLLAWAQQNSELVDYDRARGMVKFKTDLLFAPGSDQVDGSARGTLDRFADILKDVSAVNFHIYIAGHTDNVPIGRPETRRRHPNNWYLSAHRAVTVMEVLAANGIPEQRLGVMGFSEFHPVAPNAPERKGNAANRRVEIWIVPPERFMTTGEFVQAPAAPAPQPQPRQEK